MPAIMFAADEPFVRWSWVEDHLDEIVGRLVEHLQLTALAVGIGLVLALTMALVSIRWRWTYSVFGGLGAVVYAIPSVALFGLLVPFTGLGTVPAEIALVSYTLLILLRNIVAGYDGVPAHAREAAIGMGYEPWRRLLRIDLPLALPTIIAGLRIATVTTVGLVTVAALVGTGGLGALINEGLDREFPTLVVVGTVLSIALAILFDVLFVAIEWLATPWARRQRREAASVIGPQAPAGEGTPRQALTGAAADG